MTGVYENFIKYESSFILRNWANVLVADNFSIYKDILDAQEKMQEVN